MTARRGLQLVLGTFGVIAIAFGGLTIVTGASTIPDAGVVATSVDNEMRYFGAWYIVAGVLALRSARDPDPESFTIRLLAAGLLLGAGGRVASIVAVGSPHPLFLVLLGVEVVAALVILSLQAALARRA